LYAYTRLWGGVYHAGSFSLRENKPHNSSGAQFRREAGAHFLPYHRSVLAPFWAPFWTRQKLHARTDYLPPRY